MARVKWNTTSIRYIDSMWSNTEDWQQIRKTPELVSMFAGMGEHIVQELNWELHGAQARRRQPVEDGYKFAISHDRDRIRMRIWAFTARAAAHEAKHQSILKHMQFVGDVKEKGGGRTNPGSHAGGGGGRSRGHTRGGGAGTRRPGGGGGGSRRGPKSRNTRVNELRNDARLRRRLMGLDALAHPKSGATEDERNLAAEKARRIRKRLGEE